MSGIKARHGVDKRASREDEEAGHLVPEEGESSYQYWLLLRTFLYALVLCMILSSILLSQIVVVKSREQLPGELLRTGGQDKLKEEGGAGVVMSGSDIRQSVEKIVSSAISKIGFSDTSSAVARSVSTASSSSLEKCVSQWSPVRLTGRCYGLKDHSDYSQFNDIRKVKTSNACQELCCHLGSNCQTWQYWNDFQVCKLGDRASTKQEYDSQEIGDGGPWCEGEPPVKWRGGRVSSRDMNGMVEWITEGMTRKCFGFKKAQFSETSRDRMGSEGTCEHSCAVDQECSAWQYHIDRGCFHYQGKLSDNLLCDPYEGGFIGGMKNVQN